jgi:hypothetical protein
VYVDPLVNVGGASLDIASLFDFVDIYAEYDVSRSDYGYLELHGHAAYVSANFYYGNFSVLTEYKDYKNFNFKFNIPPTADHEQEHFPKMDNNGFRIEPQYYFENTNTSVFFNVGRFESPSYDYTLYHIYGGLEQWDLFDRMYIYTYVGKRRIPDDTIKFHFDSTTAISDFNSILFTFIHRDIEDIYGEYKEDELTLGYARSPWLSLSFLWQYTERPVIDKNHFFGGEVKADLLENLTLMLFAGSLKGGVICSGGACHYEKPFKGVKLSVLYRF